MPLTLPPITIGLPVYNGARYLAPALESLLAQSYRDFTIILSDNGSTDATQAIGQAYAARDSRVRYIRHEENRGAAWNFNYVFQESSSPYFKWAACDDLYRPHFLQRCKDALDYIPTAVLAFTQVDSIDQHGQITDHEARTARIDSSKPHNRFRTAACVNHACLDSFGLIRRDVLAATAGLGAFASSDRVLLAEIALRGHFVEVPERLFLHRRHSGTSTKQFPDVYTRGAWFDPSRAGQVNFPAWRLLQEYAAAVTRAQLSQADELLCRLQLIPWMWHKKWNLLRDVRVFAQFLLAGDRGAYSTARERDEDVETQISLSS